MICIPRCSLCKDKFDITLGEGRGKLRLDIGPERVPVHWTVQHPECSQAIASEGDDKGLGMSMAKGTSIMKCLPSSASNSKWGSSRDYNEI